MMKTLTAYCKHRKLLLAFYALALCFLFALYGLAGEAMRFAPYAALLLTASLALIVAFDLPAFSRRRRLLQRALDALPLTGQPLPEPSGALEADYLALARALNRRLLDAQSENEALRADALTYYGLWVHQIKTPLSAMRLLLGEESLDRAALTREAFKVERYADMALQYVRMQDMAGDLSPEPVALAPLCRACVKKYALLFVGRGLSAAVEVPEDAHVLTDRKWCAFILEQLLSNAAKYTRKGGVRLYLEDARTLVVEDTGVGIRPEDLPRIFNRSFTGGNGREDLRASGLGLYLAKRTARALALSLTVESAAGAGTRARMRFPAREDFIT